MSFVITEKCVSEVYASCVGVCPVECIHYVEKMPKGMPHNGKPFMVIDPDICIECGACELECPIGAIVDNEEVSPEWTAINAKLAPEVIGETTDVRPPSSPPNRSENKLTNN